MSEFTYENDGLPPSGLLNEYTLQNRLGRLSEAMTEIRQEAIRQFGLADGRVVEACRRGYREAHQRVGLGFLVNGRRMGGAV